MQLSFNEAIVGTTKVGVMWTEQRLRSVIDSLKSRRGDSASIEVKRAAIGLPASTPETLCAFANMPEGGTLILGVDERSGFTITGVEKPAQLEAGLVNQARKAVRPSPHIATEHLMIEGKSVIVVDVRPLSIHDKPATCQGVAYLRQSDGDYEIQEHELRMIEVEKLHTDERIDYDRRVIPDTGADALVPELVDQYVAACRSSTDRLTDKSDQDILRLTSIFTPRGEVTLTGLYMLGDFPQGAEPSLTVTAAVIVPSTDSGVRNRNLRDFSGPVPVLLDEVMAWVEANVPTVRRYRDDGHMVEEHELPLRAVRELLANALVHRDLGPNTMGTGKGIQIRLTSRNLVIQSPGGLRGISLKQIESSEHAQAAVNQRLYAAAKKLKTADGGWVIEGEGGGIREVFESAAQAGLPRPTLINTGVQFTAILWLPPGERGYDAAAGARKSASVGTNSPVDVVTNKRAGRQTRNENAVLRALAEVNAPTLRDIIERTQLTAGQIRYALAPLLDEGYVVMDGQRGDRTTNYRLIVEQPRNGEQS